MRIKRRFMCAATVIMLLAALFSCVGKPAPEMTDGKTPSFDSYKEIPGVTQDEITAIEALKKKYDSFTYGSVVSTEVFQDENGKIGGFTPMFCEWLSELFGIKFENELIGYRDIMTALTSGGIDFTGDYKYSEERRHEYLMSEPLAMRTLITVRYKDSLSFDEIRKTRPLRFAFFPDSSAINDVASVMESGSYETVELELASTIENLHQMLKNGDLDAYIIVSTSKPYFDSFEDLYTEDFFPYIFNPVSLATGNPEFAPIIAVMNKALKNGASNHLNELYNRGYDEYKKNSFFKSLTEEERRYIETHHTVEVLAKNWCYPLDYYNKYEKHWEGIAFDVLDGVTKITGIEFTVSNKPNEVWDELFKKMESGEVPVSLDLIQTSERAGRYLWSKYPYLTENYALLSKMDFPNINTNEIQHSRIGLVKSTGYAETFQKWFPDAMNTTVYETEDDAIRALDSGKIDLIMAGTNALLSLTNYYELSNYKANYIFDSVIEYDMVFNKNESVLYSIVEKALPYVEIQKISKQWESRTYDYQAKLMRAQRPLLFSLIFLLLAFAALGFILFIRSRKSGARLKKLIAERTKELDIKTATLKAIIDSIPGIVFSKDKRSQHSLSNKFAADYAVIGHDLESGEHSGNALGLSDEEMTSICDLEKKAFEDRKKGVLEMWLSSKKGEKRFFEISCVPLVLDDAVIGIVDIGYDLTDRKNTEKELELQTVLLQTMMDSIPDIVFGMDLNLNYTLCNKYLTDYFGVEKDFLIGRGDTDGLGIPTDEVEHIYQTVDSKVISENRRITYEEWLTSVSGERRLFETIKAPLVLDGEVIGIIGISHDITPFKEMEEEALAASRSKSAFVANMSHELRTPLNVVIGLTDLILEENYLAQHVLDNLRKVSKAGGILLDIVNDILDISKVESGKLTLSPSEYYTASLINDVCAVVTTRLGEKPIDFRLDISPEFPNRLYGDDLRVKQILNNLLSNAVKYTNTGTIDFIIRHEKDGKDVWLDISVRDTGVGIRKENVKYLFTDYYQEENQANRRAEGTGLGLSITKRLVEVMNGEISAESQYGKGSVFRIRIRQGFVNSEVIGFDVANKLCELRYSDSSELPSKRIERIDLRHARVLIVDDIQTNLDVTAGLLRKYRMKIDCVTSGEEAVERIRSGQPIYDVIFMDHMMPGMDGIETTQAIRGIDSEYARNVPIIALTANVIIGNEEMFMSNGFQDFLSKPIDLFRLDEIIRLWVRDRKQESLSAKQLEQQSAQNETEENKQFDIKWETVQKKCPELNIEEVLKRFGDEDDREIYIEVLHSFSSNIRTVLEAMEAVTEDRLSNYAITVHGLKGASRTIGAEAIGDMAEMLEKASSEGSFEYVLANNSRLINAVRKLMSNIGEMFKEAEDNAPKKAVKNRPDKEILSRLSDACKNYDMDGVDAAIKELGQWRYEEDEGLAIWLKKNVEAMNFAEIVERLSEKNVERLIGV